ncbi:MAG: hypothetical protein ABMA14_16805 [Hyphomonadaceae bacterium]
MADQLLLASPYSMNTGCRYATIEAGFGIIFLQVISVSVQGFTLRVEVFLEPDDFPPQAFKRSVSFLTAFRRRRGETVRLGAGWGD